MFHSSIYRLPRIFVYVVVITLMLMVIVHAQQKTGKPIMREPQKNGESKSKLNEDLFKKLFAHRRKNHIDAVRTLLKMDNYEHLYKMILVLIEKMVNIIELSKSVIEKADFSPNISSFLENTNVKDALSSILESTALFGDIILHLPNITHRILKTRQKWNFTIHWSLNFINQMHHLLDKSTITMIHLVEQELNITERDPSYFNPYRSSTGSTSKNESITTTKKSAKQDKRKKGPQIAKIEL